MSAPIPASDAIDWNNTNAFSLLVDDRNRAIAPDPLRTSRTQGARESDRLDLRRCLVHQIVHAMIRDNPSVDKLEVELGHSGKVAIFLPVPSPIVVTSRA